MNAIKIVLASASPRRKELLEQIGLEYRVVVSDVEEKTLQTRPWEVVADLSCQKAEAVFASVREEYRTENLLVIGADTVVAWENEILGKPGNKEKAIAMLKQLQGNAHKVYTGVTLLYQKKNGEVLQNTFYEETTVTFYPMSDGEIAEYVATGDPLDKAGAYGIQGFFARYIKGIEGDYNNVVGLPVGRLYQEIEKWK